MNTDIALLRLMQLVSPSLPIGMYSYSQGLESAIEEGRVKTTEQAAEWISGMLETCLCYVDAPIGGRLYDAWSQQDLQQVTLWSETLQSYRESHELRAEDRQTGQALARLLTEMNITEAAQWQKNKNTTLPTLFMLAANAWGIDKKSAVYGLLWGWLENQVLCAVKLIPLGQVAGQRLLYSLMESIPDAVNKALNLEQDQIGGSAFALGLLSSRHEVQYSRLFRS